MRRMRPWHVVLAGAAGLVLCLGVVLAGFAAVRSVRDMASGLTADGSPMMRSPGVVVLPCADTDLVVTTVLIQRVVTVIVSIEDDQRRTWEISIDHTRSVTATPTSTGSYPTVRVGVHDLDDGSGSDVQARVTGSNTWCERTVSLT